MPGKGGINLKCVFAVGCVTRVVGIRTTLFFKEGMELV
jgi:hypothetical protein